MTLCMSPGGGRVRECGLPAAGDGEARIGHGPVRVHRPRTQPGRTTRQLYLQTGGLENPLYSSQAECN